MRFKTPISVKLLAREIGAKIIGNADLWAHGINEIHKVQPGDITFVDIEKYYNKSLRSNATIILINKEVECPEDKCLLVVANPFKVYNDLVLKHRPFRPLSESISPSAQIHPTAIIEPQVIIGDEVSIGANTYIQGHCYIGSHTTIGNEVMIQAGTVIGTDAFYFKQWPDHLEKWHSGGEVIIEDRVFIGASCTINKGVSGATVIGEGTKLDSQVHIGHGVVLGKNCLLAGQVGVGGKTIVGDRVKVYGQAGIANNLEIGSDSIILAKAGVLRSLEGGKSYFGVPAEEARKKFMQIVAVKKLVE
ncbi:MAG: UDP-3-O-(3-hydroxymyristoyl)glucosamine N-acyltransferase [Saprospiraceae bacterium]|nr:UDP-3-O-(3-hydroxymyristoyl)glucosamine N-acyltransferase [Saprospiraceae bacterium]